MRLRVYWHLRKRLWSLLDPRSKRVIGHRTELVLVDVRLIVSEAIRQRVIARRRRTVHAYAEGLLSEETPRPGGVRLRYNPFEAGHFVAGAEIVWAVARADFRPDGAFVHAAS